MANLSHGDTWSGTVTQNKKNATYVFPTEKKYVDKNITLNVNIDGISLAKGQTFYIESAEGTGPRFVWTCDATTGEITITGG